MKRRFLIQHRWGSLRGRDHYFLPNGKTLLHHYRGNKGHAVIPMTLWQIKRALTQDNRYATRVVEVIPAGDMT